MNAMTLTAPVALVLVAASNDVTPDLTDVATLLDLIGAALDAKDETGAAVYEDMLQAVTGCQPVMRKASKRNGVTYPASKVKASWFILTPGKSIRLLGLKDTWNQRGRAHYAYDKTYNVGDCAEYGSYNLSYYAPITKITAKTIVIAERHGSSSHTFDVERFNSRNYSFDLNEASKRNSEWTD